MRYTLVSRINGAIFRGHLDCIANAGSLCFFLASMSFDIIILSLTLFRALWMNCSGHLGSLVRIMLRDGGESRLSLVGGMRITLNAFSLSAPLQILYFFAVFACNLLASTFELQNSQPLLKPVNASLATIGTVSSPVRAVGQDDKAKLT